MPANNETDPSFGQEPTDPRDALASIRASQDTVRDRVLKTSWRYGLLYSTVAAVMVGGQVAPVPFNVLASGGGALCFVLMWRTWSDKHGVQVSGLSPKRARWVAISLGVIFMGLMLTGVWAGRAGHPIVGVPLAIAAFGLAYGFSALWMRVYRAETSPKP